MDRVCEVCGERATGFTVDLIEVESDGEWSKWEPDGEKHWRCADHKRKPKETLLDGTVEGGNEQSPEGKAWAAKQE